MLPKIAFNKYPGLVIIKFGWWGDTVPGTVCCHNCVISYVFGIAEYCENQVLKLVRSRRQSQRKLAALRPEKGFHGLIVIQTIPSIPSLSLPCIPTTPHAYCLSYDALSLTLPIQNVVFLVQWNGQCFGTAVMMWVMIFTAWFTVGAARLILAKPLEWAPGSLLWNNQHIFNGSIWWCSHGWSSILLSADMRCRMQMAVS